MATNSSFGKMLNSLPATKTILKEINPNLWAKMIKAQGGK